MARNRHAGAVRRRPLLRVERTCPFMGPLPVLTPEARVGSLATVSGLHLEATPSLLNLGLCRAFAACPCLCNRNGVLRDVVADHHARRASDKASLWPLFGNNLRG